jgi:hypothetical protein
VAVMMACAEGEDVRKRRALARAAADHCRMASIRKNIDIRADAAHVWSALRDFGAVHLRLAPTFVVDTRLDTPGSRIVTFFDGQTAREVLVTCDDAERRLVYTIVGGRFTHHNATAQVFAEDDGHCRFVWRTDLLPDTLAPAIDAMMTRGAEAMKSALEAAS